MRLWAFSILITRYPLDGARCPGAYHQFSWIFKERLAHLVFNQINKNALDNDTNMNIRDEKEVNVWLILRSLFSLAHDNVTDF